MKDELPSPALSKLAEAMVLMQRALRLLDSAQAPADIGAHLDLAIIRLGDCMADESRSPPGMTVSAPKPRVISR